MIYNNFISSNKISHLTRLGAEEDLDTRKVFEITFDKYVSDLESRSLTLFVFEKNSELVVIHDSSEESKCGVSSVEKYNLTQLLNSLIETRKDYDEAEIRGYELTFENIKDAAQSENPWEVLGLES